MQQQLPLSRTLFWLLLAFAATAVASIALENILIWPTVILFLAAQAWTRRKIAWPGGIFALATLVFLATFFIGAAVGVDPPNSFHTVHKYATLLLIFPLGAMALNPSETRKLLLAYNLGAMVCALRGIAWEHFVLHYDRIDSFSGDKMVFGGMLMAALLFQVFFIKEEPRNPWHWIGLAPLAWALVLTETRGAWIGFAAGFILLTWKWNRKWLLIGALAGLASFFILPRNIQDRITSIGHIRLYYDENHKFWNAEPGRIMIWVSGWRIIQDHPWGVGQGNVEKVYPQYKIAAMVEPTEPHLHNNVLQLWAQNGWPGLAAYLFWILAYYLAALRFRGGTLYGEDANWAFLCVFTAVLVWGLTEYTFSHQFMNVQVFLLGLQVGLWQTRAPLKA